MFFEQIKISIQPKKRGFHLITDEIITNIPFIINIKKGMLNLLLQHTSASICLNENADYSVRKDFETFLNKSIPDSFPHFEHILEGRDDMSAHIKSALLGVSLSIPIKAGKLAVGLWQGIYLGEHRNNAGSREILCTLFGEIN